MDPGDPKHDTKETAKKLCRPRILPAYQCQQLVSVEHIPSRV